LFSPPLPAAGAGQCSQSAGRALTECTHLAEAALEILQPFFNNPAVILSALVFTAVLVPLIEEALKPAGVWLLAAGGLLLPQVSPLEFSAARDTP